MRGNIFQNFGHSFYRTLFLQIDAGKLYEFLRYIRQNKRQKENQSIGSFCRNGGFETDTNASRGCFAQSRIDYRWGIQILPPGDCLI